MLIIFGLAAVALLAISVIVLVVPMLIVVSLIRLRRRVPPEWAEQETSPDAAFVALVTSEWPLEAALLNEPDSIGH